MPIRYLVTAVTALITGTALAAGPVVDEQRLEQVIKESWKDVPPEEFQKMVQDNYQAVCSKYRNNPPGDLVVKLLEEQKATLKLPESGKLMGDWKEGEKLSASGYGGRIGSINPDDPQRPKGGNCYACHAMDPKEVAYGNLGPSLTGFGKLRGNTEETIRYAYEKIYNAAAFFPCTNMPRFGHNGHLTEQQMADIVAYMVDPESPVNK